MTLRSFLGLLVRGLLLGVLVALVANAIEGAVQAGWGVPRRSAAWMHGIWVYLHAGAWVGLGWALLVSLGESLVPRRYAGMRPSDALVAGIAFTFLVVVGGYWLNLWPSMPSFTSAQGKLVMAGLGLVMMPLFYSAWWLVSRVRRARGASASGGPSIVGGVLALIVLGVMAFTWPRGGTSASSAGSPKVEASGPPVIVILVDTLRRDHLSCYGYPRETSPRVDALAEEGVLFEVSTTSGNFTIPSVASLFTGRFPSGHGVVHASDDLPTDLLTLAERFAAAGYRTGAFVGNPTVRAEMGFARGFSTFHPEPPPSWVRDRRTAIELLAARLTGGGDVSETARLVPRALEWLGRPSDRPPFFYLHLIDPHSGYVPPREYFEPFLPPGITDGPAHPPRIFDHEEEGGEWVAWEDISDPPRLTSEEVAGMVARYDGEIRFVDEWVGRVLDRLRDLEIYDESLIVFLSDHGEEFGEHGGWFHGRTLYGEMVDMPLVMKLPRAEGAGRRTRLGVHMVDLVGTLSGLAGIDSEGSEQGRDLSASIRARLRSGADPLEDEDESVAFNERPPYLYSLRLGGWKIIQRSVAGQPRWQLFDLENDPGETLDRAADAPNELVRLQTSLAAFMDVVVDADASIDDPAELDPETLRVLRSLGYVE